MEILIQRFLVVVRVFLFCLCLIWFGEIVVGREIVLFPHEYSNPTMENRSFRIGVVFGIPSGGFTPVIAKHFIT